MSVGHIRTSWVTAAVCSRTSHEMLSSRRARVWFCLAGIITTDFQALYAYKCGEYQRCLQLSTHNVQTLLAGDITPFLSSFPEFIQLMDNNIASLVGLTLIVNMSSREDFNHVAISQLSLSLYLMSQCQMKLHHSATSLTQTLHHVEVARRKPHCQRLTLDQLLLKLTERNIQSYLVITQQCLTISGTPRQPLSSVFFSQEYIWIYKVYQKTEP